MNGYVDWRPLMLPSIVLLRPAILEDGEVSRCQISDGLPVVIEHRDVHEHDVRAREKSLD
jgi:hypothetical protein